MQWIRQFKVGGIITLDGGVFNPVVFELAVEAPVEAHVSLGVGRISGIGKAIQEVGRFNRPLCLRNRIFSNLIQA